MKPDSEQTRKRASPALRWGSILLRSLHLGAVILLGAALHGAGVSAGLAGAAVLVTGVTLLIVEVAVGQVVLGEAAGAAAAVKLLPVAGVIWLPEWRLPLFWFLVFWSSVFSHAPKNLRHWRAGTKTN